MIIKTFEDKKREKETEARELLDKMENEDIELKEAKQLKKILENPYESTKKEVVSIALIAAEIKETGLETDHPVVKEWTKKELGIGADEFSKILDNVETPEEVKLDILEKMEAPKDVIKEAINTTKNKTK